jgi:Flp pilus assembly protein TadG
MQVMSTTPHQPTQRSTRSAKRRGTSAVEFALVAPVFLLFLMGIIEFGRVMMVQNVLITSAREGARAAIISGATADSVKQKAENYASISGVPGATATVEPADLSDATTETPITVTVSVNFDDVSWLPAPWFLENQNLSGQTTMRLEGID